MPCNSQDGLMTSPSGPEAAPANPLASPAEAQELQTPGICGQSSTGSSASADLQSSLASKLRRALGVNGSPECSLIWKEWDMPGREPICAQRASARRTSGSGSTGSQWPTPQARDYRSVTGREHLQRDNHMQNLNVAATYSTWPTPTVPNGGRQPKGGAMTTTGQTPDGKKRQVDINFIAQATWSTPRASDGEKGGPNMSFGAGGQPLPAQAAATWPTPTTRDGKDGSFCPNVPTNALLGREVWSGDGEPTAKRGALNPEFVCWLMGFPGAWDACGVTVTRSSRKSRRRS